MRIVSEEQIARALQELAAAVGAHPPSRGTAVVWAPRVVASGNFATPQRLINLLDSAVEHYRLFALNANGDFPDRDGVVLESPFVGPAMRHRSRLDYLPMRLSLVPQLFRRSRPPDVALLHTSTISSGRVSLGIEVNVMVAAIEQTRARGGLVVAQLNRHMPYTLGEAEIDCDQIDLAIEVDEPIVSPIPLQGSAIADAIAAHVAPLVDDGCTLQLGIGAVPDATLESLSARRGLAVWTEMISDGVLRLERAGALDSARPIVTSFMFGSPELYRWVDHNPRIRMTRTETTNDPSLIASQPGMISINGAFQVDLYAQANADRLHGEIYSGFGGQPDFTEGALHSRGGHAVIALPSWHAKSDSSNVVETIGGQITSFQHSAIVSEHGVAHIFGRSQRAQARLIIDQVAHPDAREQLREAAVRLGLT